MQGRVHYYEGYTPQQVTFPMRVLGALGMRAVVLTNAAGGIAEGYRMGQLVALADHINLMGWNPLVGPNEPRFGFRRRGAALLRHDRGLLQAAARAGARGGGGRGIRARRGRLPGGERARALRRRPRFAPFARWAPRWWACPRCRRRSWRATWGIEVLGISCVTNLAAGLGATPLSHEEVFEAGRQVEHGWPGC